jgi:amidase
VSDLHELSACEQVRALRAGEVSSRDLTEHYLERVDQLDGQLGAFVTVSAELARSTAARADERLAGGESLPLLGLPLGIKDMHATAGVRTTLGTAALAAHVPADDAWTVGRLRQAGAVLVGKTSTSEFGATCFTHDALTGAPAVTPYGLSRYASGSSGGAASAVAAGLLPLAHASDGAGSIRTPAATCHLVGVKPSRGLVSAAPATSFFNAGTEGAIARTVEDAALLLDVMAEPWAGDLYGWRLPRSLQDAAGRDPERPLKVAVWTETGLPGGSAHPGSVAAVQRAARLMRELGHDVREVPVPQRYDEQMRQALTNWFAATLAAAVPMLVGKSQIDNLTPYTRWLLDQAASLSAADALVMQSVLARYASTYLVALEGFDIALTPTTNGPPVPVGSYLEDGVDSVADRMLVWSCYTPWVNLTGQPAVSLPSHLDADGLPHGVQLVGRPREDGELLALAAQLQRAGLWEDVPPPLWYQ